MDNNIQLGNVNTELALNAQIAAATNGGEHERLNLDEGPPSATPLTTPRVADDDEIQINAPRRRTSKTKDALIQELDEVYRKLAAYERGTLPQQRSVATSQNSDTRMPPPYNEAVGSRLAATTTTSTTTTTPTYTATTTAANTSATATTTQITLSRAQRYQNHREGNRSENELVNYYRQAHADWIELRASLESDPTFNNFTLDDWNQFKTEFIADRKARFESARAAEARLSEEERASKVRLVEHETKIAMELRLEADKERVKKAEAGAKDDDKVKPNIATWAMATRSSRSVVSRITRIIPWHFLKRNSEKPLDQICEEFAEECEDLISLLCPNFFSDVGDKQPEVRHHYLVITGHIQLGATLIRVHDSPNWLAKMLLWYQTMLGACLALKFHRRVDFCTKVVMVRGCRISLPTEGAADEVEKSEVDIYATIWGETTIPENFEKWYKNADAHAVTATAKLGSNSGLVAVKGKENTSTKAGT